MPNGSPLLIGRPNSGTQTTILSRTGDKTESAFDVENLNGIAISASTGASPAVAGASVDGDGVDGTSRRGNGVNGASELGWGVFSSTGIAGLADAGQGAGVVGTTQDDNSAGIYANVSTSSAGVWGQVSGGAGGWPGVEGYSFTGNGVRGVSVGPGPGNNVGVVGFSNTGNGVVGIANSPSPNSWGVVSIGGLVNFGGSKNSAVRHPDGSHRLLYCMESPESWFEDFGRATLVRGRSRVKLDPSFAAVVRTEDYHVFLCPEGDVKGLYVSRRNRVGFEVRENEGGKSSSKFSFRVVARRKDVKAPRFSKVVVPQLDTKELQKTPKAIEKIGKLEKKRR